MAVDGLLDRDRAARRHHCRGEDGRDVAGGDRHESRRRASRRPAGARGRCGPATGSCADPEQLDERGQRSDRGQRRDPPPLGPDLGPAGSAACAIAEVTACHPARPDALLVGLDQLAADFRASGIAGLDRLRKPDPCPYQERLDGRHRNVERIRNVRVRHAGHLAHQQCRALLLGQATDVGDQPPERFPSLGLGGRIAVGDVVADGEQVRERLRAPQLIDAAVVRDPVEPWAERHRPVAGAKTGVRAHEHVLERILDVGSAPGQHLTHVSQQSRAVAIVDDAEGLLVALTEQRDQLLVRAQSQERGADGDPGAPEARTGLDCGSFHSRPLNSL
jgi:hypothetical protein